MNPADYLGAPDVFISYSRTDASVYVNRLAARLSDAPLYCIIDQWHSEPGRRVPKSLLRLVRKSRILVVVGTNGAQHSTAMEEEIRVFLTTGRTIVPVDADGSIRRADWWHLLDGLTPVADQRAAPKIPAEPAPEVVDHVLSAVDFVVRDQRLKKAARWSQQVLAGALALFLVAAGGTVWWVRDAGAKVSKAQQDQGMAEAAAKTAKKDQEQSAREAQRAQQEAATDSAKALAANNDAKLAEGRAAEAKQLEVRTRLIAEARSSLTARDPDRAFQRAREALGMGDGDDARLLLAEAWNSGIEAGRTDLGGQVAVFEVNPAREYEFAVITNGEAIGGRLEVHRRGSALVTSDQYRYLNVNYDPSGDSIYAIGSRQEKPQTPNDSDVSYSSWLIHYDLNLKPLAEPLKLGPFPIGSVPNACQLRSADSMRIDGSRLLFAGSCGRYDVRPIVGWVDLREGRFQFSVDPKDDWSYYTGQIAPIDPDTLVVDSPGGFFLLNLHSSERVRISTATSASDRLLAASPDGKLFVAASTENNEVTVFRRGPTGKWHEKTYQLDDPDGVGFVGFVSETRIALVQKLGSVWLLDVDPYYDDRRLAVSFEGDNVAWREPAVRKLGNHDGSATGLAISPDGKWIATAGADNTVRLWSPSDATERLYRTGLSAGEHLQWSKDSRSLYVADESGAVHIYQPDTSGEFNLRANPLSTRPEARVPTWLRIVANGPLREPILEEHYGYINYLDFGASGNLAVHTYDNIHTEWDDAYRIRYTTFAPASGKPTLAPRPVSETFAWNSRRRIVSNENNGTVDIYDETNKHPWLRLSANGSSRLKLEGEEFSPRGEAVALALDAGGETICVVDLALGRVWAYRLHYSEKDTKYEVSDDGSLVVAYPNGRVRFSDAAGGPPKEGGHGNVLPHLAMSPDGMWFATAGVRDGTVRLWSYSGSYSEYKLPYQIEYLKFSASGKELLAGSASSIHAWAVPTTEVLQRMGISPAQSTAKEAAPTQSHLASSGLSALLYNQAAGVWQRLPEQTSDPKREPTPPAGLARVLASDVANPGERLAAARSLARTHATDPQAIDASVEALRSVFRYPAIAVAALDYVKFARGLVQPVLLARLQAEKDPQAQSALLWAAGEIYPGLPEVQTAARQGMTSQNPELRLVSAKIVAGSERNNPKALGALLVAFLSWKESPLVPRDEVRRLVLECEPKLVVQALETLPEREEAGAIGLIGGDYRYESEEAAPILWRLADAPLKPQSRVAFTKVLSLDSENSSYSSSDYRQKTLSSLKSDSGTDSCFGVSGNLLRGITPDAGSEIAAIAELVLDKVEKNPSSEICLRALGEVVPLGGIPLTRVLRLLERESTSLEPLSYGINDVVIEDLEDAGIPADVINLLRTGIQDEWQERTQFEERMRKDLGEETWMKWGPQIVAAAGKPRTKGCDVRDDPTAAVIDAIGAYGTEASEAEQPLREMAEKYKNCTDVVPAIAKTLNEISGMWKPNPAF